MFKILSKLLCLCVITFVICLALIVGVAYFALSGVPYTNQDVSVYQNIGATQAVSSLKAKINVESSFFLFGKTEQRKLFLSKDELNTAFMFYTGKNVISSLFGSNAEKQYDTLHLNSGSFNSGIFTLSLTQKIPYRTPFGSYLNFMIKAVPEIKNSKLSIGICSFELGKLKVPAPFLNFILKMEGNRINDLKEIKKLVNAIKELKTSKDGVSIVYYPDRLSQYLFSDILGSSYSNNF